MTNAPEPGDQKSEREVPKGVILTPETRLAIHEMVGDRFEKPPATFLKLIEDEVEKRIEHRVRHYRTLVIVVVTLLAFAIGLVWKDSLVEARKEAIKKVAEDEVIKAANTVRRVADDVEQKRQEIQRNYDTYTKRLEQIRAQDNVVLREKDGSLHLNCPVWFHGSVVLDRTDGGVNVYGMRLRRLAFESINMTNPVVANWIGEDGACGWAVLSNDLRSIRN